MRYSFKKLPDSVVELEAVLTHQEFLNYYQSVYDAAISQTQIKGFRPGTAPKDLADRAINKEKIFNEAAAKAARDSLKEISQENNWQLIDQPVVEVLEGNPQADIGLKFKITLTIFPEIKLGNYQRIVKKILADRKDIRVEEKEVEEAIKWVLNSRAKLTRVIREAQKGDAVEIEFSSSNAGASDFSKLEKDKFILGEGRLAPGFEGNIVGHKEGDHLEFSVNFPKDYWNKKFQDKKVDFKVKLNGVFERQIPQLNDEFVKSLGRFQSAEDFRKSILDGLTKEKEIKERERLRLKMMEEIIKESRIPLPAIMVNRALESLTEEYKNFVKIVQSADKSDLDVQTKRSFEEKAKNNVAANLVLYKIAKNENLEPSPEEIEAETNEFLKNNPSRKISEIDRQRLYDYSYGIVQNRKVFEYLESLK